jgi:predicted secreted hydrolase
MTIIHTKRVYRFICLIRKVASHGNANMTKRRLVLVALLGIHTLLMAWAFAGSTFQKALPGYVYQFPRDHGNHERFKTEWWYTTGHLQTLKTKPQSMVKPYGFELTFFRSATGAPQQGGLPKAWQLNQVYPAHFAITDISQQQFFYTQRMNRPAYQQAGADSQRLNVWNENWRLKQVSATQWALYASHPPYTLALMLTPQTAPVVHGLRGVSQKANCVGCASHYYSVTRLAAKGTITMGQTTEPVAGLVWMDHEFGSNQLTPEQIGWDWFSIQLADGTDWMFYQMRLKQNRIDPNSSGTGVIAGKASHLPNTAFTIRPLNTWRSPNWPNRPAYPSQWQITIPSQQLTLTITPQVADQELAFSNQLAYWEGACRVSGLRAGKPVTGQAYVELTGYAQAFRQKI